MKTTRPTTPLPTAIYGRLSKARRTSEGKVLLVSVARQVVECRELARRRGWAITGNPYVDNDISASKFARRRRPQYRALLEEIQAGHIHRVLCFKLDRLYRRPVELEELIVLAEAGKVEIVPVHGGELDLNSAQGRVMARVVVAMAAGESENTSERIRSEKADRRKLGLPNGSHRPFGWQKNGVLPHPTESKVLVKAMDGVLTGRSLSDIAREWNAKQVKPGRTWSSVDVGRVLRLPRHAGLLTYKGDIIKTGSWTPLVAPEKWKQVVAILDSRSHVLGIPRRRSMLTNILRCGSCGGPMRRTSVNGGVKIWICPGGPGRKGCGHVSVRVDNVEPLIVDDVFDYVDRADLAALIAESDPDASARAKIATELTELDRREDEAGSMYVAKRITGRMAEKIANDIKGRRAELERKLGGLLKRDALSKYAGKAGALRRAWPSLSVDQRRAVISESIGTVAIMPARVRGGKFDPSRIVIGNLPRTRSAPRRA